jgi:hypothetical protein
MKTQTIQEDSDIKYIYIFNNLIINNSIYLIYNKALQN